MKLKQIITGIDRYKMKKFITLCQTESPSTIVEKIRRYIHRYVEIDAGELKTNRPRKLCRYEVLKFPRYVEPQTSIIISLNAPWEYTYFCLKNLSDNAPATPYEIIVVSNDKKQAKELAAYCRGIKVADGDSLRSKICGSLVYFMSNDTMIISTGWFKTLAARLQACANVGVVGSKVIDENNLIVEAGCIVWHSGVVEPMGKGQYSLSSEHNYVKEVDAFSIPVFLTRKEVLECYGRVFIRTADDMIDFCLWNRSQNNTIIYQPKSVVVKFNPPIVDNDNNFVVKEKWKPLLKNSGFEYGEYFHARDRSNSKKTIVVVDHYVPHYDQDAGSRVTWFYIKLFLKMGLKVIFVGDNYFRHQPYTDELELLGVEVLAGDGWNIDRCKKWIKNNAKYISYVYLNRPHIAIKYIDFLRKETTAKLIYFGHDLHFIREQRQYEIEGREELLKSSERWKKIESELFSKADVIYTPGDYEKGIVKTLFPEKPIRAIPIYIYDKTQLNAMKIPPAEKRKDMIFVGGFNHQPNEDGVLWFVKEVWPLIIKEIPGAKLYVIGSNPTEKVNKLANSQIIVTGFVSDEELGSLYNGARVFVAPLRYGAGVKGKIIEAMSYGVPIITTPIGAEGLPRVNSVLTIARADDPELFAAKTLALMRDDVNWRERSETERRYIYERFSVEEAQKIIEPDFA